MMDLSSTAERPLRALLLLFRLAVSCNASPRPRQERTMSVKSENLPLINKKIPQIGILDIDNLPILSYNIV